MLELLDPVLELLDPELPDEQTIVTEVPDGAAVPGGGSWLTTVLAGFEQLLSGWGT